MASFKFKFKSTTFVLKEFFTSSILTVTKFQLVERGTKLVLEQIVTTIASVADTVEKDFIQYYDRLMPCLKYIIANATTQELKMLRGKTIECVSLIGKYSMFLVCQTYRDIYI